MVRLVPLALGVLALVVGAVITAIGNDVLPAKWLQNAALVMTAIGIAGVAVFGLLVRSLESDAERKLANGGFDPGVRTPGDSIDERLGGNGSRASGTRADLRDRFERAAVTQLVREHGCSPEQARTMLAEGTWTDDDAAARFFAEGPAGPSVLGWIRGLFGRESAFETRAERASTVLFGDGEP